SSDAAAVLLALCNLFNIELNSKRLKDLVALGTKLGADVPVFLYQETFCKVVIWRYNRAGLAVLYRKH
ncbi:MAG: hypothetical protein IJP58_01960, partial [Clostridia bacterium]|nr:hypothetical protein [Clostridia bacterium]